MVIYKVDTEKEQELAGAFGIRSIPSILFIPMEGKPEMAYFVTSFAEDDLAFGESTVVLPACQVDRELVEQLLSLYRVSEGGMSGLPMPRLITSLPSAFICATSFSFLEK